MIRERILKFKYKKYEYKLDVVITENVMASRRSRDTKVGHTMEGLASAVHSYNEDSRRSWLFLPFTAGPGLIAHESLHFVNRLYNSIGSCLDDASEEVYAYELDYLVDKIAKFIKKQKKKLKKKR